jgi:hypothetical protein
VDVVLNLMTPCTVTPEAVGLLAFTTVAGDRFDLSFDSKTLIAVIEPVPLDDPDLRESWGQEQLLRIQLRPTQAVQSATWCWRLQARRAEEPATPPPR